MAYYYIVSEKVIGMGNLRTGRVAEFEDDYELLSKINSQENNELVLFYKKIGE